MPVVALEYRQVARSARPPPTGWAITTDTYRQLHLFIYLSIYIYIYIYVYIYMPVVAWEDQRAARSARPLPMGWAITTDTYMQLDLFISIFIYIYIYTGDGPYYTHL